MHAPQRSPSDSARPRWFRRHPRRAVALFLCCVYLVLDVSIPPVERYFRTRALGDSEGAVQMRRPDLLYHHGLRPMRTSAGANFRGVPYTVITNDLGFRDREMRVVPMRRAAGTRHRLLIIGDSFTEGIGFDWDSTLVGHIANALAEDSIEVLNAGVASYSPVLMERKLRHYLLNVGLVVDEVAVVVDLSDQWNEREYHGIPVFPDLVVDVRPAWRQRIGRMGNHSLTYSVLRDIWRNKLRWAVPKESVFVANHDAEWDRIASELDLTGLNYMVAGLDSIRALTGGVHVPISLTMYPWPAWPNFMDASAIRYRDRWRAWSRTTGVPLIDLFPTFEGEWQRLGSDAAMRAYFLDGDVHWNARGGRLAADLWLRRWCEIRPGLAPRACAHVVGVPVPLVSDSR